ncbi:LysR family transcriptional regulator [Rhodobacteraceae bacterium M382]|nr:LysR family transcriptional regulator [Rhodobacteraceae bacterium M382]
MIAPRRLLPSVPSLLALEAVDRLGSASAAAEDLSLTQSAISRQLKQLEEQMEVELISRDQMRLRLTPAGSEFAREARFLLSRLAQASVKLRANRAGTSLDLSILPSFGLGWLAPRLRDFARLHPDITVNLQTHTLPFDFGTRAAQAAIHYGKRDWPDVEYVRLMSKRVRPVCAPSLIGEGVLQSADLLGMPLLHLQDHPDRWERWFAHQGVQAKDLQGMLFDQSVTMTQAAVHGLGVALLSTFQAQEEVDRGRLCYATQDTAVAMGDYFLVWPRAETGQQSLTAFRTWLVSQALQEEEGPG